MLSGISVVCFASSYAVVLGLELSRFFFRATIRKAVSIGFTVAGLFAHLYFLASLLLQDEPVARWYFGCLALAAALALTYLIIAIRFERTTAGIFLLPTALALIAAAHLIQMTPSDDASNTLRFWALVHGYSLMLGTALVVVGFVSAVMYLVQANRLKRKKPPKSGFWLPSLEWLEKTNERSLHSSIALLGVGLVSGILLNLDSQGAIPWSDPLVWASLVWLLWLFVVLVFHAIYKPSRQGRKVAYLTVGSFLFLGAVVAVLYLLPNEHTSTETAKIRHSAIGNEISSSTKRRSG